MGGEAAAAAFIRRAPAGARHGQYLFRADHGQERKSSVEDAAELDGQPTSPPPTSALRGSRRGVGHGGVVDVWFAVQWQTNCRRRGFFFRGS